MLSDEKLKAVTSNLEKANESKVLASKMRMKSNFFKLVLNVPDGADVNEFEKNLITMCHKMEATLNYDFYWIKHDKDIKEDGEIKTLHYHLLLVNSLQNKVTLKTIFERVVKSLNVDKKLVSIESFFANELPLQVQYLVHLNDATKAQYEEIAINTNRSKNVKMYLTISNVNTKKSKDTRIDIYSWDDLVTLMFKLSKMELYQKVDSRALLKYRSLINDFYDAKTIEAVEIHHSKDAYYKK